MAIQSTTGNYFRTAAHAGIRQKVVRRGPLDLPGGLALWRSVGKTLLWTLPVILAANLWLASACNSINMEYRAVGQALIEEQHATEQLLQQKSQLLSPVRIKIAAAEKFGLYEPASTQIKHMN
jgi:hypothetical protein